jgi:AcrR family transcriptional regulator
MDRTLTKRPVAKASAKKALAKPAAPPRTARKVKLAKVTRRVRLSPEDRKKLIIDEAIRYFAEVGFDGGTRQLALRLGITQPLIFRYFPNKDDLIQAVYNEVFLSRWRIEWEVLLEDRSRPLRERLIDFYKVYTEVIFNSKWMRIFLYSGLRGLDLNKWYINFAEERIHRRVCSEIRAEKGIKLKGPITGRELELYWVFHGGIFYHGVRQFAYGVPIHLALEEFIEASVDSMLNGMPAALKA